MLKLIPEVPEVIPEALSVLSGATLRRAVAPSLVALVLGAAGNVSFAQSLADQNQTSDAAAPDFLPAPPPPFIASFDGDRGALDRSQASAILGRYLLEVPTGWRVLPPGDIPLLRPAGRSDRSTVSEMSGPAKVRTRGVLLLRHETDPDLSVTIHSPANQSRVDPTHPLGGSSACSLGTDFKSVIRAPNIDSVIEGRSRVLHTAAPGQIPTSRMVWYFPGAADRLEELPSITIEVSGPADRTEMLTKVQSELIESLRLVARPKAMSREESRGGE